MSPPCCLLCLLVHEVSMHISGTPEPQDLDSPQVPGAQKPGCPVTEGTCLLESDSTQLLGKPHVQPTEETSG